MGDFVEGVLKVDEEPCAGGMDLCLFGNETIRLFYHDLRPREERSEEDPLASSGTDPGATCQTMLSDPSPLFMVVDQTNRTPSPPKPEVRRSGPQSVHGFR